MQEVTEFVNKTEIIKQIPLFSELNWIETWMLLSKLTFFEYKKNEIIYQEGQPSDGFYLLISGRLQALKKIEAGEEKTFDYITRNKYFGILSLLTDQNHSASVKVINDAFVLKIKKDDFQAILKRTPKIAVNMSQALSWRIRRRRLNPQGTSEAKIITLIAGSHNVGKNMYAANLSLSLAKETGKKVMLLDLNTDNYVISRKLGLDSMKPVLSLSESSLGKIEFAEYINTSKEGVDVVNLSVRSFRESHKSDISQLISFLMEAYSYIFIIVESGLNETTIDVLKQSDIIHIIVNDEKKKLQQTRVFFKEIKQTIEDLGEDVFIVVNENQDKRARISSEKRKKILQERIHTTIPYFHAPEPGESFYKEVITYPDSEFAKSIRTIAREIGEVRVGLALSGGAALGLAHVGVLKVLEEENIDIDFIAGTSMGAFLGSLWASGATALEIEKVALALESKFATLSLFDLTVSPRGLVAGKHAVKLLKKNLKVKSFEELKIPFITVACDLESRQEVIFDEGDVAKAVRASIAIPGVFVPVAHKGGYLLDGGVLQPLPVQLLIKKGVNKIIAVNVLPNQLHAQGAYQKYQDRLKSEREELKKSNFLKKFFHHAKKGMRKLFMPNLFDAIVISMQASESILAEASGKQADVCLHPDLSDISWFEFFRARELIKRGEDAARGAIAELKEIRTNQKVS